MDSTSALKKTLLKWYLDNGVEFNLSKINKKQYKPKNSIFTDFKENTDKNILELECSNALIDNCKSLQGLKEAVFNFSGCLLKKTAKNTVFSDGNPSSKLMLLGEAPGEEDDKAGIPFLGESGVLLNKMLGAIGQDRNNTYLSNIIFWRPPGNRKPTKQEIDICLPFVQKHIELVKPKILVLLGATAAKAIYGIETGITQVRGNWKSVSLDSGLKLRSIAIFHPGFLLKQPSRKKEAWEDLKKIKIEIDKNT